MFVVLALPVKKWEKIDKCVRFFVVCVFFSSPVLWDMPSLWRHIDDDLRKSESEKLNFFFEREEVKKVHML